QEEQKFANIFLNDVQRGDVKPEQGKTFREYITEYLAAAKQSQINEVVKVLGSSEEEKITAFKCKLSRMMNAGVTEANIRDFGHFDDLRDCVYETKAKAYFEEQEGASIPAINVNAKITKLLEDFIISDGFDLKDANSLAGD
ncbi:MAG: hypothetical protein Q9M16_05690, partial [Mariprofundus sp.]|nr:hypothetical protein [Mariprofundus sp.]